MLSIFYQIQTHPPCSAGIIMTITIVIIAINEFTLFDLLFNMDDLLERKYPHHLKKQRTVTTILLKHAFYLQTCVSTYSFRKL